MPSPEQEDSSKTGPAENIDSRSRAVSIPRLGKTANTPKFEEKHEHIRHRGFIAHVALGLSDGLVTNLAFLAGFAGAISNIDTIRFAGIAAMLAGAVSMFFGGVMAARSEHDLFHADSRRETHEIEHEPEEERHELRSFYLGKGLTEEEAEIVVRRVTSDKRIWLEDLLMHELHIHETKLESPFKTGVVIGLAFLVGAFVPLSAYLFSASRYESIIASATVSLGFLFVAGAWKGRLATRRSWRSGIEMLLVGAIAAALLYAIGTLLVFV